MELNDAFRRILRQHWPLIVWFIALGLGVAAIHSHNPSTYTATTRFVLGADDPKSRTEAVALADAATAIATSPSQVRDALSSLKITNRDPVDLGKHHISVRSLGTSGVMQLSVSDKNSAMAASIANALAKRVLTVRQEVADGDLQSVMSDLETRIDGLNHKIAVADQQIDQLNVGVAIAGSPTTANSLRAKRDEQSRLRDFLAQQRGVLESERIAIISSAALRPKPSVISAATTPDQADASRKTQELVLGALLGLIVGVGAAGLLETLRPTFVGSDALARVFDTPLLGTVPADGAAAKRAALTRVARRLCLAADADNVRSVGLVVAGPEVDLDSLAAQLDAYAAGVEVSELQPELTAVEALAGARPRATVDVENVARPRSAHARVRIRPFGLADGTSDGRTASALALVAPNVLKKAELDEVDHLLRVTRLPVVGLITYQRSRVLHRTHDPFAPDET
jgi:capsular polysaccharide biosynthesis protein